MTDQARTRGQNRSKSGDGSRQNSYAEKHGATDTDAPDILQPGSVGDFGNDSSNVPEEKSMSTALPSKHSASRTPGNQPELAHQVDEGTAQHPDEAAEPSNTYSGT